MRALRVMILAVAVFGLAATEASPQFRKLPSQSALPGLPGRQPTRPAVPQPRQRKVEQPANRVFWTNLQTVSKGTSIEVDLKSGERLDALMESVDDNGLTVRIDARLETIARDQVDRVSRFKTRAGEMAIAGAVGGGLIGAVAVAQGGDDVPAGLRLKVVGAGAVGGALFSAMTGLFQKQRVVVYFSR